MSCSAGSHRSGPGAAWRTTDGGGRHHDAAGRAAPILDRNQQPLAAMSVTGTLSSINRQTLTPAVRTAALGVTRVLQHYPK
jgi:DNA-binding IclR family transcriptional regulator